MRVSIIVPVFNVAPELLRPCLESIARQTLRTVEHEVVIVDDASDDASVIEVVEAWSAREGWTLVRHSSNRGLNAARRTGVQASTGDYVLFVDGDDMLTRDAAELLLNEAVRHRADFVTAPMFRWNRSTLTYATIPITAKAVPQDRSRRLREFLGGKHTFTMCGRLIRRSLLDSDVFDMPDGTLHEDLITTPRLQAKVRRVASISLPIYYYTVNTESITQNFTPAHAASMFFAIDTWRQLEDRIGGSIDCSVAIDRLVNTAVTRCMLSPNMTTAERIELLDQIAGHLESVGFDVGDAEHRGTALVFELGAIGPAERTSAIEAAQTEFLAHPADQIEAQLPRGVGPSNMALRLKDKLVFIAQVDYQVRNAARLAAEMRRRGVPCAILDNSNVIAGGKRRFATNDRSMFHRIEHIVVDRLPYPPDWLSTARMVVTFNDFSTDAREALEFRTRLNLPTACMIEGINDFLRVDFDGPRERPYRRCDHVLLAGEHDRPYFEDRDTHVVGVPIMEELSQRHLRPTFPEKPLAVLNVNFTYGSLEDCREGFVQAAAAAFSAAGIDWTITQHPMDRGDLADFPVSSSTQYELIDRCSVFVSRFATGILEALASGKPAIYFNPHHERVEKFAEPMGAFPVCTTVAELLQAVRTTLDDIEEGVDFRARAAAFLRHHTGLDQTGRSTCGGRFAAAIQSITESTREARAAAASHLVDRLALDTEASADSSRLVLGPFERAHSAQMNEEELISRLLPGSDRLMFDVGANFGNSLDIYLGREWNVHAFEPDPMNREQLLRLWPGSKRLTIVEDAVSDVDGQVVPFFASDESTGISGLSAFTEGHRQIAEVRTTTLATYTEQAGIDHVDFLKIDVEGFDKFAFDGYPWDRDRPDAVLTEYEDSKTVPLGYSAHDLAQAMVDRGYTVYLSEWFPIVRYGIAHDWRWLKPYDPDDDLSGAWGNFIGFLEDPGIERLREAAELTVRFGPRAEPASVASPPAEAPEPAPSRRQVRRPWYADVADRLRSIAPRKYAMLRHWRRSFAKRTRHSRSWLIRQFANGLREGMPTIFRCLQPAAWVLRWCRRHRGLVGLWLVLIGVFTVLAMTSDDGSTLALIAIGLSVALLAVFACVAAAHAITGVLDRRSAQLRKQIVADLRPMVAAPIKEAATADAAQLREARRAIEAGLISVRSELAELQLHQDAQLGVLPEAQRRQLDAVVERLVDLYEQHGAELDHRFDAEGDRLQRRLAQVEARVVERLAGVDGQLDAG